MTDAPPGRYKVVERGRRLVVIDTRTGQPAAREMPAPTREPKVAPPLASGTVGRGDSPVLTTSPFYDLNGPRQIAMTPAFNDRLGRALSGPLIAFFLAVTVVTLFFPMLWIGIVFALLQPKVRGAIRGWITARLDEVDQAAR